MDPALFHRFESPLNRIWHSFLSVLLFSLSQANEQAEDNEADDGILIKWEGELGHWLGNAGEGTSLILTAMRAMRNRKKKNPWNETCGCPLLLKVINQGYSSGSWRGWASPQYLSKVLVGHKHLLQWSLAEATGILCCCPEWAGHHFQWVLSRWSCFSPTGTKGRWNLTLPCPLQAFVPFQSHQNKGAVVPLLGSP